MKHSSLRPLALVVGIALAGVCCSSSDDDPMAFDSNDYNRSCTMDEECVVIYLGGRCSCACDTSAINVSDRDAYFDDRGSGDCDVVCGACEGRDAACESGTCESVPRVVE